MRVLSNEDLTFWHENGYVILHEAAPPENLRAVVEAIWEFQEMNPDDPETWYRTPERSNGMPELNGSGMVEMYHHPALWANRQLPRIHGAFADLWDTENLWVTIDRANMNVPNRPGFEFEGFIHWDIDTSLDPLPFDVQGVLSLTDTLPGQGGFQCVAGMPKRLKEWIAAQPADRNPHRPDLTGLKVTSVETQAGDLLIWNSQLPHGVSPNHSSRPRMAQYISMSPAQEANAAARQWRIDAWLHRRAPQGDPFPGDPRDWERIHGTTAELTPLGRKLLGLDSWDDVADGTETGDMKVKQERGRTRATPRLCKLTAGDGGSGHRGAMVGGAWDRPIPEGVDSHLPIRLPLWPFCENSHLGKIGLMGSLLAKSRPAQIGKHFLAVCRTSRFKRAAKRFTIGLGVFLLISSVSCYGMMFVWLANGGLTFTNELSIPDQLFGTQREGRLEFRLVVDESTRQFLPDQTASTAGVNGPYLGPTLRMRRGDKVDLVVENELEDDTTMHWHGMHVPAPMDGTPHQSIGAGESWTASFEVDQQAATMWYHPHPHGNTGRQVYRGIAGLLLIDDDNSESLDLPNTYGVDDFPLIIQDRVFDHRGEFRFVLSQGAAYGNQILVNGTWNPFLAVEARRIRLRLLNASNARIYHIGFEDNREFHQIATDGGFLETPVKTNRVVLAPGERAEILVDFSDGREVLLKSFPEAGFLQSAEAFFEGVGTGHFNLLKIKPQPTDKKSHGVPEKLNSIVRMTAGEAAVRRPMVLGGFVRFDGGRRRGGRFGGGPPINGKTMDMHRVDEVVRVGDTEIWELTNRTGQAHPFHVHLVQFQILDRNGQPPAGVERGWKDTVLVHPSDRVRIIMRFSRYADPQTPYMYHCHIMEHEDRGMMGQFLVVEEPDQLAITQDKPTVVIFIAGFSCEHCYEQVQLFDARFAEVGINLVIVTPEAEPDATRAGRISATIVPDPAKKWAGWMGLLHEGPAHGTFLLDREGHIVWGTDDETPFMDVDAVLERVNQL